MAYSIAVLTELVTVAETQSFIRQVESVWTEEERQDFIDYIARNPEAGDVIPDTGGIRKVRWGRQGAASVAARGSFISSTIESHQFTC